MKKTFLMTAAAVAIFAVACEKDEINALNNDLNTLASVSAAGDKANADALAVESARLQSIIDLNKIAQEEGDDAIRAAIEAHVAAIEASIIEASEEAAANLAAARAEVLELLAAAQAEINVRLEDLASVDVELAEADADLQDALDVAQANLDSAIADLEAADESNLAEALEAVAVARAAAEAAIAGVDLEGGKDGLSEDAVKLLIQEAVDAIPAADLSELIDRLDDLEAVEVPAGFDDADLIESIALVQGQIDDLVIQSVDDINKFIADAIADLADNSDISGLQSQINDVKLELENLPDSFDDSDIQEKLTDLQNQITELAGVDFYTYTPYTPEFVAQISDFTQTRTASLTIIGSKDSQAPVAIVSRTVKVVAGTPSDEPVLSADVPADSLHGSDDGDGLNKYVKTSTIYTATSGVDAIGTHTVVSYGSYEDADAAIDPIDGTELDIDNQTTNTVGGDTTLENNGSASIVYSYGGSDYNTLALAQAAADAAEAAETTVTIVKTTTQPRNSVTTDAVTTITTPYKVKVNGIADVPAPSLPADDIQTSTVTGTTVTAEALVTPENVSYTTPVADVVNGTDSISWGTFTAWSGTASSTEAKVTQTRTRDIQYTAVDANDGLEIVGLDGVTLYGEGDTEIDTREIDNPAYSVWSEVDGVYTNPAYATASFTNVQLDFDVAFLGTVARATLSVEGEDDKSVQTAAGSSSLEDLIAFIETLL